MNDAPPKANPRLFEIAVVLKGLHGIIELVGAAVFYVVSGTTIYNIIASAISFELREDPNDYLANLLLTHTHVTTAGKDFVALYLLVAASVNIVMSAGLLLHRRGMFPAAMSILAAFVFYQLYAFAHTLSVTLLALSLYDAILIWLIYGEYQRRWPRIESPGAVQ